MEIGPARLPDNLFPILDKESVQTIVDTFNGFDPRIKFKKVMNNQYPFELQDYP